MKTTNECGGFPELGFVKKPGPKLFESLTMFGGGRDMGAGVDANGPSQRRQRESIYDCAERFDRERDGEAVYCASDTDESECFRVPITREIPLNDSKDNRGVSLQRGRCNENRERQHGELPPTWPASCLRALGRWTHETPELTLPDHRHEVPL